tara:strand:- start:89560 stop:91485 length:1926 start_codon:yes stop_codon:yes gene_type:complete
MTSVNSVKKFFVGISAIGLLAVFCGQASADAGVNQLTESEQRSGWQLLFDGESTEHWRNYNKDSISDGWKVVDGALVRAEKKAGDIVTKKKYASFELSIDFKISPRGNSGVMFHVAEGDGPPWHTGPEVQIQDNSHGHDPQKAGWLYQLYKPTAPKWANVKDVRDMTRPPGEWNQLYIRVTPKQSEVCMNGVRYYTFVIGNKEWKEKVAASKFAKFEGFGQQGEGHICLQDHGNEVAFRNIKIRELPEDGSVPQPIDGQLGMSRVVAFPDLQWDQWEPIDDSGKLRPLRLMELTYANDDSNRLFVCSQQGAVWTFENRSDVTKSHLVLDLRGKVHDWKGRGSNEQGLLGLAMHPDFKSNGYFYVYYSHPTETKSVVSRFTMSQDDPNRADPKSELVLMEIDEPFQNHNGGSIEFGPDGYLYLGVGDGGDRNDPFDAGQDVSKLLGKILRIDVNETSGDRNYGIPADNPFVDDENAKPEVYAIGLRNPWRIAFDRQTGDLWCGDVGQELWEEVNVITKGGNYGWSNREGMHPFGNRDRPASVSEPIDPVWEYDHRVGRSITGGRVYRGSRLGALAGKYLYADYVSGSIWALTFDRQSGRMTRNEQVVPDSIAVLAFGQDPSGEVYFLTEDARGQCINRFEEN